MTKPLEVILASGGHSQLSVVSLCGVPEWNPYGYQGMNVYLPVIPKGSMCRLDNNAAFKQGFLLEELSVI